MKIIVLSDSHHDVENMVAAVLAESPDVILHLGDNTTDAYALQDAYPHKPMFCVSGNNDYAIKRESEQTVKLAGKTLFMTHGHHYNVKNGIGKLQAHALEIKADIALFGHTHKPVIEYFNGLWLVNPGSIGRFLYGSSCTCGIITIENDIIDCKIVQINE